MVVISLAATQTLHRANEVAKWRDAHQEIKWVDWIDLQSISGEVHIDPEDSLRIDLNIDFTTISTNSESILLFSFNPGMTISVMELNGLAQNFSFQNGILSVSNTSLLGQDELHTLRIVANGVPNPRFAYFDSPLDYESKSGLPLQVTKSFGVDGSIFRKEYVALMPGSHWYPIPGPINNGFGDGPSGLDFFELDLQVELSNPLWKLVGPGVSRNEVARGNFYALSPTSPVSEFGLFASRFESALTNINGLNVSIYLHERHAKNLSMPEQVRMDLINWLNETLNEASELGLSLVHDQLSLVDVPSRLRTVGGGWRMDSLNSTPGVILLKERGFPVAPIRLAIKRTVSPEDQFFELLYFFRRGLGTDNVAHALQKHYWSHATSASGTHAEILDLILTHLAARLHSQMSGYWFSPYSTMPYVSMTTPSLWQATSLWMDRSVKYRENIHREERRFAARSSVLEDLEDTALAELPSRRGHQRDFELVLLKCSRIADAMVSYHINDAHKLSAWLSALREEFKGQKYQYEDLLAVARRHEVSVDPFLTEWLTSSKLPGFVASQGNITKLANSDDGQRRNQISFSVRNTEPVGGFVVSFLGESSYPVRIEGNSAKRINLVWHDPPIDIASGSHLYFNLSPGLSLNRYGLYTVVFVKDIPDGHQRDLAEHSDWAPKQEGIIVDDLDEGFSVLKPRILRNPWWTNTLVGWFQPQSPDLDYRGIVDEIQDYYSPRFGRWTRTLYIPAYGLHGHTLAIARMGRGKILHAARFAAEIPDTTRWLLEYRVHNPPGWASHNENSEFKVRVEDERRSWDVNFDPATEYPKWKAVGEFDVSSGTVHVDVTGTAKGSLVYADAIRWTKVDETTASTTHESDDI